jgi:chemotaxis signal transduction protein
MKAVGVLCLCFDFQSEVERIFAKLRHAEDWTILAWLDQRGTVVASSDPLQMPEGVVVPLALEEGGRVVRFAGREYLAVTTPAASYQGYLGPGWYGHAMLPLEHAFEHTEDDARATDPAILAALAGSTEVFTEALRKVPEQADAIQRELNRSVWNGNVRLASRHTENNTFAKALLREISATGEKTKEVFARSIGDLHETVLSSILQESRFVASLAVEVMDRNLYERVNDCRWWALNGTLRDCLAGEVAPETAAAVLENINRLYTVYDNLVLFDKDCKTIAVSNAKTKGLVGRTLHHSWAKATLSLHSSQAYGVSAFELSDIYADRRTYVFTAAIRSRHGRMLGGIGIVFDSEPQFRAMVQDVLPRSAKGAAADTCIAVLADAQGRVISATSRYKAGDELRLPAALLAPRAESIAQVLAIEGHYYAVAACRANGYREFQGVGATAIVMMPIGIVADRAAQNELLQSRPMTIPSKGRQPIDLATFFCAGQWFAVPAAEVVEAIDNANVTSMPGRGPASAGVIKYRNQIVPLLNLDRLIRPGSNTKCDSIIVVAAPNQPMIGLQVAVLGDVVEAPADCIMQVAELLSSVDARLAARMVRPDRSNSPLLLLLDPGALIALMRPPQAERLRA